MEKKERENIVSEHSSSEKFISYLLALKQLRKLVFVDAHEYTQGYAVER